MRKNILSSVALCTIAASAVFASSASAIWQGEGASACPKDVVCMTSTNPSATKEITMVIWPHTVNKNSEDESQVLRVKEWLGAPWKKFSGNIEWFSFVPGHAYMLKVKKERGTDSITGKRSYRYTLIETLKDQNVSPSLANTEWKVESVGDYAVNLDSNFVFTGSGFTAKICNSISGSYIQDKDKIHIDAMSTRMMCHSPSMPLETALNQKDTVYDTIGGKLHIRTSYGLDSVLTKVK